MKLSRPRLAGVHPRERLFVRLDQCLEHTAVWVDGVPGAGKTTLIASYLSARKLPALWYRTDSGDTDPAAACHYLQVAANGMAPQLAGALPAVAPAQMDDPRPFLRRFFGIFYACIGSARFLVVDNAQEALSSASFRTLLLAVVSEAPQHIGVIIVSRSRPPGDFARLLANGEPVVLGADELLFSEDESTAVQQLALPRGKNSQCLSDAKTASGDRRLGGRPRRSCN
ncbi:MAG: hypothetical protein IPJ27_24500 [Candidatus Accumulibacter sp.]|uniref:Nephrocystin 3-like N-terminal domain-containing protein n=1 Tax=Candidatus Accumulibacter proximus TaxID=2954385 RepID=A0A935Q4W1_9PROT|nr:hypothetical protein [Candidatus Accumulibacter proximus]